MGKELKHFMLAWEEDIPTSTVYKGWGQYNQNGHGEGDYWTASRKVRIYYGIISVSVKDSAEILLRLTQYPDPEPPVEVRTTRTLLSFHLKSNGPENHTIIWRPGREGDYIELSENESIGFIRHLVSYTGATITYGFEVQAVFYYEEVGR